MEAERELFARLPPLSPSEQALWVLDATINQRGFCIDRSLAEAARKIAQAAGPEIDAELAEVTGGAVTTVNQVAKLQAWLEQNGCAVKDLQKKTVATLLEDRVAVKSTARARAPPRRWAGCRQEDQDTACNVPATMAVSAAHFSFIKHPPAVGPARESNRKI